MENQERDASKKEAGKKEASKDEARNFIPQIQRSRDEEGHRFFDELENILTRRIEEVKSTPQNSSRLLSRSGGHWIFMR